MQSATSIATAFAMLLGAGRAAAIDPATRTSQYWHTAWHMEDRVFAGAPYAIAPTHDTDVDYTALSFKVPQEVRFRHQLEGRSEECQEVGTRRQAFFSDLRPGTYTFHVTASNNDGLWNEGGASWNFSIAPAFYQALWFQTLMALAGIGAIWVLYRLRLRHITAQADVRYAERLEERTRIARDLHDTLLQSLQALLLNFHSVTHLLPNRPVEAREALNTVIEEARLAIIEGRNAVEGLRASQYDGSHLETAIGKLAQGLAAYQSGPLTTDFSVTVQGATKGLNPIVATELYHITAEALRNAFQHAQARRIEVEICYDLGEFRLRVRDNGKGIEPHVLHSRRTGHYGITGMRERARLAGGTLVFWSELNAGTEVELTILAPHAYANLPDSCWLPIGAKIRRIFSRRVPSDSRGDGSVGWSIRPQSVAPLVRIGVQPSSNWDSVEEQPSPISEQEGSGK